MPSFGLVHALSRRWIAIALVLALGVSLSVGAFFVLRAQERRSIENDVREEAELRAEAVADEVNDALAAVRAIRALQASSDAVSREEFDATAGKLLECVGGTRGNRLGAVRAGSRREAYERLAGLEGAAGFRFTELTRSGRLVRAARREATTPSTSPCRGQDTVCSGTTSARTASDCRCWQTRATPARKWQAQGWGCRRRRSGASILVAPIYHPGAADQDRPSAA